METKKQSLTVEQAIKAQGLIEKLIQSDKENKFVFSSSTRIRLSQNLRKTRPEVAGYNEDHRDLVVKLGKKVLEDGKDTGRIEIAPNSPEIKEYVERKNQMLGCETEITLRSITVEELFGYSDEYVKAHPEIKQNQIDLDLLADLQDVGLVE
jgi:hypothetical protein